MQHLKPLSGSQQRWLIGGLIGVGCCLRLLWADDMKWQADEIWMYETAHAVATGQALWPGLGMRNGVGLPNPGLSVWSFIAMAHAAPNPVALVRWVQGLNIAAILLFVGFICRSVPRIQQPTWLWGLAIASVNPVAMIFSRKIGTQDILPFVAFFVVLGHWHRRYRWGAALWGLSGLLMGQIHMSGFFWQMALTIGTAWTQWRHGRVGLGARCLAARSDAQLIAAADAADDADRQVDWPADLKTHWGWWLLGTTVGLLPMLSWLQLMATSGLQAQRPHWAEILTPNFHLHWLVTGWGLNLEYELERQLWQDFWQEPRWFGLPTFGAGLALGFLVGCALWGLKRWVNQVRGKLTSFPALPELTRYCQAAGIVMPLLMLAARLRIPAHYLNCLFPWLYIWVAMLFRDRPRILGAICMAQLCLTLTFLVYVHTHGGVPDGNYGTAYRLARSPI
jgi:hypothetical protein